MKKHILLLLLSILSYGYIRVTGPSHITSEISPISINENGDILCRTRFTKNEMGAHKPMKTIYGYCVITPDSIIEYKTQEVDPDDFHDYNAFSKSIAYWNAIYDSGFDATNLSTIGNKLKHQYVFKSTNVSSCKTDTLMSIADFETNKSIDLDSTPQLALYEAKSTNYSKNNKLHILYDFGHVVVLENNININANSIGADFDYFNPWTNTKGEIVNMGFDVSDVTGILRTPK